MKVWTCEFEVHWPVGTAAVVVAPDKLIAYELMHDALCERGLSQSLSPDDFTEVDIETQAAHILCDGNY